MSESLESTKVYESVVLGGTFDRLHSGHKVLLEEALKRCSRKMTIGVTDESMTKKKVLHELIQPCEIRMHELKRYLQDRDPKLDYKIVPISDPFGPSIVDKDIQAIIGSEETEAGCRMVNEKRLANGLGRLDVICVRLAEETSRDPDASMEEKASSSNARKMLLGTRMKPRNMLSLKGDRCTLHIIGLTGGSASGKSSVAKRFEKLGAGLVDADKLGHEAYRPGTECFRKVVEAFGQDIVTDSGDINRKVLGAKVFGNKDNKIKLESIVWPEIRKMAQAKVEEMARDGKRVVILDAAVLLAANWHKELCDEVWGCIIPRDEAIRRICERDGKTEEEAGRRIDSQLSNAVIVEASSVIFCTQWSTEFTQKQVEKAWTMLLDELGK